jgi:hypothetical protein
MTSSMNPKPTLKTLLCILLIVSGLTVSNSSEGIHNLPDTENIQSLYQRLQPAGVRPPFIVFSNGIRGYFNIRNEGEIRNQEYLTLIDYSLSSTKKRLWVIDINGMRVVHHTLVAHGMSTGGEYAERFSNIPRSHMSSLGFYVTGNTYYGKHGLSLQLEGIEAGINDNARKRAIVMHGASYVSSCFVEKHGRLGRSYGCPALPCGLNDKIVQTIQDQSCLFIYYPDNNYISNSRYLNYKP